MTATRLAHTTILTLFLLCSLPAGVAADEESEEEYEVQNRVVRISLISGEVTLRRNEADEWENALQNSPLVEGDLVRTGADSYAEIQVDARSFIRLASNSALQIVTLRDEGIALSLSEGTASVRLASLDREKEYFELDAPGSTLAVEQPGDYRVDVLEGGRVRITVREGGRGRIYSANSGFLLRDGRSALLNYEVEDSEWELTVAAPTDSWDEWVAGREQQVAENFRFDSPYYDNQIWGAEDLENYGSWNYASDYGWIWRPHVTVINNYQNWAPYRHGQWTWLPHYGWTWVGHEPWGWAPYHYGRWVYYKNYWAWCPRSYYYRHRSWWRPALVAFVPFNHSFGPQIYWYPLSYRQRDPYSRHYRPGHRWGTVHSAYWRAVTGLTPGEFGRRQARLRYADETIARRVFGNEPVRNLPFRPTYRRGDDRREETRWRRTGADERTPGTWLNDRLRRSRVWNGRQPRNDSPGSRGPGVVNRRPSGGDRRGGNGTNDTDRRGPAADRLPGKVRMVPDGSTTPSTQGSPQPTVVRPIGRPSKTSEGPPVSSDRPRNVTNPRPESRPQQPDKVRTSPPTTDTPGRSYKPPAPRSDPPPQKASPSVRPVPPPERSSPAPAQRAPRYEAPPARTNPPPARSAPPPRSDSPRSEPPARKTEPARESRPEGRSKQRPSAEELKIHP